MRSKAQKVERSVVNEAHSRSFTAVKKNTKKSPQTLTKSALKALPLLPV